MNTLMNLRMMALAIASVMWVASVASAQRCLDWNQRSPRAVFGHAMAYDQKRDVFVVFGGISDPTFDDGSADTWERDGDRWVLRSTVGPEPRWAAAMAYDSRRGVMVMFGGLDEDSDTLGDTWEWDGQTWTLRTVTGPPAVYGHAMAYDPERQVTVLSTPWGGTWEWNGQTWDQRSASIPNSFGSKIFYDSHRESMISFGGSSSTGLTWEYDGDTGTWAALKTMGPSPRYDHVMAYDSNHGAGVLFGGLTATAPFVSLSDTWIWHSAAGEWTQVGAEQPGRRRLAGMDFDSRRGQVVVFGGRVGQTALSDGWALDAGQPDAWQLTWAGPPLHTGQRSYLVYDASREVTVLLTWSILASTTETWEWDGGQWTLRSTVGPPARGAAGMVFDSVRGVVVLFGGAASGPLGDTWEWNGSSWTLMATSGPPPRWDHAMAFDSQRGVTVLFGGTSDTPTGLGDTWEWDGRAWTQIAVAGPSPRYQCVAAFDATRGVTVLFGGRGAAIYRDTWTFNGFAWTHMPAINPASFSTTEVAMVFDTSREVMVLFGENRAEWNGSHWRVAEFYAQVLCYNDQAAYDIQRNTFVVLDSKWPYTLSFAALFESSPRECLGDVDLNGIVNVADLTILIFQWGVCPPPPAPYCTPDLNGNGQVDADDLIEVILNWSA
jgi:hypothetical protein